MKFFQWKSGLDVPNYVSGFMLMGFALFLDIYFMIEGGSTHEDWLGNKWSGGFFDWLGLLLWNVSCVGLGLGMLGKWQVRIMGVGLNHLMFALWVISIGLIAMG